jgi:excisionase family DNA binding protein
VTHAAPRAVPHAPADEALWTVAEVAAFLKVSRSFVYQACAAKTLPHVRIGASLRFDPATLRAWVRGEHGVSKVVTLPGCR